jgi:ubiquinol-cytochrome c reductase iron-sulfur subunit
MADNVVVADEAVDLSRRKFLTNATIATGAVGAVFVAVPFVESWTPSERARALGAPTELDITKIDPGQMTIITWRRQPIYVVRRTPEMVGRLQGHDGDLKDPTSQDSKQPDYAKNVQRSRTAEYLVLIGTCTHLGCLPKQRFEAGMAEMGPTWPGGYFCPCHGSRFDLAGRVFKGSPASVNLVVPPYEYPNEKTLRVGADETEKGAA